MMEVVMKSYLISYEYKEKNGCLVSTKTDSKVITVADTGELNNVIENIKNRSYDKYMKILFCQKI